MTILFLHNHVELLKEPVKCEVKKIVDEFIVKRDKGIEKTKRMVKSLLEIRNSVGASKEIFIPQDLVPEKIEEAAKSLIEHFGTIPEKVLICCEVISSQLLRLVKLEKVVTFNTEFTSSYKLPSIYLVEHKGQKLLIADLLHEGEDRSLELFPTISMRVLILSGVKSIIIMTVVFGVDPDIRLGEVVLFENYVPVNVVCPFIGKYCKKWSEQFLDVAQIFNRDNNSSIKKVLEKVVPVAGRNVAWVNPIKTYMDRAELKLGQGLRMPIITTQGITQSLVAFDMKKQFITIGIVKQNLNSKDILSNEKTKELAGKLIDVFATN